jgi:hypothetical protein
VYVHVYNVVLPEIDLLPEVCKHFKVCLRGASLSNPRFIGVRSQFLFQIALWLTHKSKDRPADEVFINLKTSADEIVCLKEI